MEYLKFGDLRITHPSMVSNFSEQTGYQYATHDIATGRPVLQGIGASLSSIEMTLQLNVMLGHDVIGTISLVDKMRESGRPQLLVFADGMYRGDYVIASLQTNIITTASNGRITYAEITLSLQEYAYREVVSVARKSEKNTNEAKRKMIER